GVRGGHDVRAVDRVCLGDERNYARRGVGLAALLPSRDAVVRICGRALVFGIERNYNGRGMWTAARFSVAASGLFLAARCVGHSGAKIHSPVFGHRAAADWAGAIEGL